MRYENMDTYTLPRQSSARAPPPLLSLRQRHHGSNEGFGCADQDCSVCSENQIFDRLNFADNNLRLNNNVTDQETFLPKPENFFNSYPDVHAQRFRTLNSQENLFSNVYGGLVHNQDVGHVNDNIPNQNPYNFPLDYSLYGEGPAPYFSNEPINLTMTHEPEVHPENHLTYNDLNTNPYIHFTSRYGTEVKHFEYPEPVMDENSLNSFRRTHENLGNLNNIPSFDGYPLAANYQNFGGIREPLSINVDQVGGRFYCGRDQNVNFRSNGIFRPFDVPEVTSFATENINSNLQEMFDPSSRPTKSIYNAYRKPKSESKWDNKQINKDCFKQNLEDSDKSTSKIPDAVIDNKDLKTEQPNVPEDLNVVKGNDNINNANKIPEDRQESMEVITDYPTLQVKEKLKVSPVDSKQHTKSPPKRVETCSTQTEVTNTKSIATATNDQFVAIDTINTPVDQNDVSLKSDKKQFSSKSVNKDSSTQGEFISQGCDKYPNSRLYHRVSKKPEVSNKHQSNTSEPNISSQSNAQKWKDFERNWKKYSNDLYPRFKKYNTAQLKLDTTDNKHRPADNSGSGETQKGAKTEIDHKQSAKTNAKVGNTAREAQTSSDSHNIRTESVKSGTLDKDSSHQSESDTVDRYRYFSYGSSDNSKEPEKILNISCEVLQPNDRFDVNSLSQVATSFLNARDSTSISYNVRNNVTQSSEDFSTSHIIKEPLATSSPKKAFIRTFGREKKSETEPNQIDNTLCSSNFADSITVIQQKDSQDSIETDNQFNANKADTNPKLNQEKLEYLRDSNQNSFDCSFSEEIKRGGINFSQNNTIDCSTQICNKSVNIPRKRSSNDIGPKVSNTRKADENSSINKLIDNLWLQIYEGKSRQQNSILTSKVCKGNNVFNPISPDNATVDSIKNDSENAEPFINKLPTNSQSINENSSSKIEIFTSNTQNIQKINKPLKRPLKDKGSCCTKKKCTSLEDKNSNPKKGTSEKTELESDKTVNSYHISLNTSAEFERNGNEIEEMKDQSNNCCEKCNKETDKNQSEDACLGETPNLSQNIPEGSNSNPNNTTGVASVDQNGIHLNKPVENQKLLPITNQNLINNQCPQNSQDISKPFTDTPSEQNNLNTFECAINISKDLGATTDPLKCTTSPTNNVPLTSFNKDDGAGINNDHGNIQKHDDIKEDLISRSFGHGSQKDKSDLVTNLMDSTHINTSPRLKGKKSENSDKNMTEIDDSETVFPPLGNKNDNFAVVTKNNTHACGDQEPLVEKTKSSNEAATKMRFKIRVRDFARCKTVSDIAAEIKKKTALAMTVDKHVNKINDASRKDTNEGKENTSKDFSKKDSGKELVDLNLCSKVGQENLGAFDSKESCVPGDSVLCSGASTSNVPTGLIFLAETALDSDPDISGTLHENVSNKIDGNTNSKESDLIEISSGSDSELQEQNISKSDTVSETAKNVQSKRIKPPNFDISKQRLPKMVGKPLKRCNNNLTHNKPCSSKTAHIRCNKKNVRGLDNKIPHTQINKFKLLVENSIAGANVSNSFQDCGVSMNNTPNEQRKKSIPVYIIEKAASSKNEGFEKSGGNKMVSEETISSLNIATDKINKQTELKQNKKLILTSKITHFNTNICIDNSELDTNKIDSKGKSPSLENVKNNNLNCGETNNPFCSKDNKNISIENEVNKISKISKDKNQRPPNSTDSISPHLEVNKENICLQNGSGQNSWQTPNWSTPASTSSNSDDTVSKDLFLKALNLLNSGASKDNDHDYNKYVRSMYSHTIPRKPETRLVNNGHNYKMQRNKTSKCLLLMPLIKSPKKISGKNLPQKDCVLEKQCNTNSFDDNGKDGAVTYVPIQTLTYDIPNDQTKKTVINPGPLFNRCNSQNNAQNCEKVPTNEAIKYKIRTKNDSANTHGNDANKKNEATNPPVLKPIFEKIDPVVVACQNYKTQNNLVNQESRINLILTDSKQNINFNSEQFNKFVQDNSELLTNFVRESISFGANTLRSNLSKNQPGGHIFVSSNNSGLPTNFFLRESSSFGANKLVPNLSESQAVEHISAISNNPGLPTNFAFRESISFGSNGLEPNLSKNQQPEHIPVSSNNSGVPADNVRESISFGANKLQSDLPKIAEHISVVSNNSGLTTDQVRETDETRQSISFDAKKSEPTLSKIQPAEHTPAASDNSGPPTNLVGVSIGANKLEPNSSKIQPAEHTPAASDNSGPPTNLVGESIGANKLEPNSSKIQPAEHISAVSNNSGLTANLVLQSIIFGAHKLEPNLLKFQPAEHISPASNSSGVTKLTRESISSGAKKLEPDLSKNLPAEHVSSKSVASRNKCSSQANSNSSKIDNCIKNSFETTKRKLAENSTLSINTKNDTSPKGTPQNTTIKTHMNDINIPRYVLPKIPKLESKSHFVCQPSTSANKKLILLKCDSENNAGVPDRSPDHYQVIEVQFNLPEDYKFPEPAKKNVKPSGNCPTSNSTEKYDGLNVTNDTELNKSKTMETKTMEAMPKLAEDCQPNGQECIINAEHSKVNSFDNKLESVLPETVGGNLEPCECQSSIKTNAKDQATNKVSKIETIKNEPKTDESDESIEVTESRNGISFRSLGCQTDSSFSEDPTNNVIDLTSSSDSEVSKQETEPDDKKPFDLQLFNFTKNSDGTIRWIADPNIKPDLEKPPYICDENEKPNCNLCTPKIPKIPTTVLRFTLSWIDIVNNPSQENSGKADLNTVKIFGEVFNVFIIENQFDSLGGRLLNNSTDDFDEVRNSVESDISLKNISNYLPMVSVDETPDLLTKVSFEDSLLFVPIENEYFYDLPSGNSLNTSSKCKLPDSFFCQYIKQGSFDYTSTKPKDKPVYFDVCDSDIDSDSSDDWYYNDCERKLPKPKANDKKVPQSRIFHYNVNQREVLKRFFKFSKITNSASRKIISRLTGLSAEAILSWFRNRKYKKK